jgi:hypothetical protein
MNKHASLNRIDRLVWNEALNAYVPAAETARGCVKRSTRSLVATVLALSATVAQARPDTVDFVQPNAIHDPASVRLWVELAKEF